ncbi:MAG TPA: YciI family protein [Trueperaceae bacterium]
MTFLVLAKDGTDPGADARRQAVRQEHLAGIGPAVKAGSLQVAGALLDAEGNMIGSMLVMEADSRQALEDRLQEDIYSRAGVWQSFEIYPFKRAV